MRYQAKTPNPCFATKSTSQRTTISAAKNATTNPTAITCAVVEGQLAAAFVEIVEGGAEHCRDREKERELGRRRAADPEHQPAHDRRPGARDARDHRQDLATPDRRARCAAASPRRSRTRGNGRIRSISRIRKPPTIRLIATTQGENSTSLIKRCSNTPADRRRQKRNDDVRDKALRRRIGQQPGQRVEQALAVDPADGQDRAELDHDLENLAARSGKPDQLGGEDQMAGRGDRQKLGQSLDDAEDDGGNEQGVEHVVIGLPRSAAPADRGAA